MIVVDTAAHTLGLGDWTMPCTIGRGGALPAGDKREGDGVTPLGDWPIRGLLLRPDRLTLEAAPAVPWRWLRRCDGWSDDPADPAYNRPVRLPHRYGAESLWREDEAYDAIVVLGHNDVPPVAGRGSAIFWHVWVPDADGAPRATEGCVAIASEAMRRMIGHLAPGMTLRVA